MFFQVQIYFFNTNFLYLSLFYYLKGAQRKKEYPDHTNEKLLEVQKGLAAPTY